jgi:hypothetical protein
MRRSFLPSIVPNGNDQTVYVVLNEFGRLGRAYCETNAERADLESGRGVLNHPLSRMMTAMGKTAALPSFDTGRASKRSTDDERSDIRVFHGVSRMSRSLPSGAHSRDPFGSCGESRDSGFAPRAPRNDDSDLTELPPSPSLALPH